MQRLLLCLLRLGKETRILKGERSGERDLFEVVEIELPKGLIGAATHREDADNPPAGPHRKDHPSAYIRELLLHICRHARKIGQALEAHLTTVNRVAQVRREIPSRADARWNAIAVKPCDGLDRIRPELRDRDTVHVNQLCDALDDRLHDAGWIER